MVIEQQKGYPRSHLFTVRIWKEEIGTNQCEWRGKVQLFPGGEVRYFREWNMLVPVLIDTLAAIDLLIEPDA